MWPNKETNQKSNSSDYHDSFPGEVVRLKTKGSFFITVSVVRS